MTVSVVLQETYRDQQNRRYNKAVLAVTGLASGNNSVRHGLPVAPYSVLIEPTSSEGAGTFNEYQAANATYIYLHAPADSASCNLRVEWRP